MSTPPRPPLPSWPYFLAGGLCALALFLLGAASFWLYSQRQAPPTPGPAAATPDLYAEAWRLVEQDFFGDLPSPTARAYGAIRGSLQTLHDPYTYFVEPAPAVREQEQLQGHFGGIGAYLLLHEDGGIYLSPMVERPAQRAGVREGDRLLAVDGAPLPQPADLDQATNLLRGPVDSVVEIRVARGVETLDFRITREQIELPTVSWRALEEAPRIGYVRIERFSGLSGAELAAALRALAAAGADAGLILDLRGNPGGLFDAAVTCLGPFLDGGVVVEERNARGESKRYQAAQGGAALHLPLAVLVDEGSASAAEIVAGALADRGRAILVGRATFGKGSIQRVHRLADNSALHITFARWYTPSGRQIDGQGLPPAILVPPDAPGDDPILAAALAHLRASIPLP